MYWPQLTYGITHSLHMCYKVKLVEKEKIGQVNVGKILWEYWVSGFLTEEVPKLQITGGQEGT